MSRDLKIESVCDHQIFEELLQIKDLKYLQMPRSISSQSDIELRVNGYKIDKNHPQFGWSVQEDSEYSYSKRYIVVFNNKRKSLDDFYELTYYAIPQYCPKCTGLRIHNDISYSALGKANMVQYEDKLLQEVKKGIATELGSNPFHDWIGTRIYQLVGTKVFNVDSVRAKIIEEITRYLEKYLDIQLQQAQYQEVTDRESFYKILSIEVEPDYDTDISSWTVAVIFQNRTGADMIYEKEFQIPGHQGLLYK